MIFLHVFPCIVLVVSDIVIIKSQFQFSSEQLSHLFCVVGFKVYFNQNVEYFWTTIALMIKLSDKNLKLGDDKVNP